MSCAGKLASLDWSTFAYFGDSEAKGKSQTSTPLTESLEVSTGEGRDEGKRVAIVSQSPSRQSAICSLLNFGLNNFPRMRYIHIGLQKRQKLPVANSEVGAALLDGRQ